VLDLDYELAESAIEAFRRVTVGDYLINMAHDNHHSKWEAEFCKCFDNAIMCLFAWCVPCGCFCMQAIDAKLTLDKEPNAAVMACLCAMCCCCYGAGWNRTNIRKRDNLEGSYFVDCLLYWFCGVCAVTQEWQHVMKKRKGSAKKTICDFNAEEKK
jgi:Cys-rich protein (TIGR01571 family)